ncbi:MAG: redox-sensing transcriptional repressor Rex [Gemmatimonadales bacterium]|nr:MAG: redox-sensing transcriptional repressor Rex [Gemmatimonadales bacterium]
MNARKISDSTVRRLSLYLNLLRDISAAGTELVSSVELANGSGTTAAKVRKDLSNFGSFGKRGQGYLVLELQTRIEAILGLQRERRVALVGVGKIGSALLGYHDLKARGFQISVAFDIDPEKVGRTVFEVPVVSMEELENRLIAENIEIVILATPPAVAQIVVDRVRSAGVAGILSFAASKLEPDAGLAVRWMDVALELEGLSFLISSAANGSEGV